MNTIEFINEIKSRLRDMPEDTHTGVLLSLMQFIPHGEHINALSALNQYGNGTSAPPEDDVDFLEVTEALCERIEAGAYKMSWDVEYDYEYYEEETILLDHNGLAEDVDDCLTIVMKGVERKEYEKAFQAFELLFEIAVDPDGEDEDHEYYEDENGDLYYVSEWISIDTMFDHNLIHLNQDKMTSYYVCSAIATLSGGNRTEKIYSILYPSFYNIPLSEILLPLSDDKAKVEHFIDEWIDFLVDIGDGKSEITISPYSLGYLEKMIVEAVVIKGEDALFDFVKQHGVKYQSSYIELINHLLDSGQFEIASGVAKEALGRISGMGKPRMEIADLLLELSGKTHDKEMMKIGVLEGFLSCGDLKHFLAVLRLDDEKTTSEATHFIRSNKRDDRDWYCIRFLINDYISVWDDVRKDNNALGWSYSEKGKTFPLFIALLAAGHTAPVCLRILVGQLIYGDEVRAEYFEVFQRTVSPDDADIEAIASWCMAETLSRVDAIVGGKHRQSYEKTALLLVSLAETVRIRKSPEAAMDLIIQVKNKYPRHRAFHASLKDYLELAELQK
jgi:hypothetical protein